MKIVDDNLVWMYEPSTIGTNKDVETIITGDTDSDYVKAVRCKDCKYHLFSGSCDNDYISRQIEHCGCYPDFNTPDDFFCKYGERKETDE